MLASAWLRDTRRAAFSVRIAARSRTATRLGPSTSRSRRSASARSRSTSSSSCPTSKSRFSVGIGAEYLVNRQALEHVGTVFRLQQFLDDRGRHPRRAAQVVDVDHVRHEVPTDLLRRRGDAEQA